MKIKIKIDYQKIILVLSIVLFLCFILNDVQAAITINSNGDVGTTRGTFAKIANGIVGVISYIGEMAASGIFATITALINVLTVALFLVLQVTFVLGTGDITHIPMPDTIVFNRFAFFDPNFINPAEGSITLGIKDILANLFDSFYTIAIALFVIAAMVTGLKMALSTIASKKAQYKETALKWFGGFLILICLKWIIAGIFYLNEVIVANLYSITKEVKIPVYVTDMIPIFGKLLTDLIKSVASLWGGNGTLIEISGYLGICLSNLARSIGGDIISSIVGFIVLGQTLTIVGAYLKRTFMAVLLGVISPLIVAADTISSATGKQSTIFKKWLKNFTITVFMQSIHALYMVVVLQILSKLYAKSGFSGMSSTQIGIITIVLTTGLVKLEKLFKSLFNIEDGLAGDLKDGSKSLFKAMGAVKGLAAGAKAVGDNAGKYKEASKKKKAYTTQLNILKGSQDRENASVAFEAAKRAKSEGNMDEYYRQRKIAAEQLREAKKYGMDVDPKKGFGTGGKSDSNSKNKNDGSESSKNNNDNKLNQLLNNQNNSNSDYLQQILNAQNNPAYMTREQKIQRLEEGIASAQAEMKSARLAQIMGPANIAAGLGMGLGMGEDVSEALFRGGYITAALDKGAEVIGYRVADKDRKSFVDSERRDGEKYGYQPSDKIEREKGSIEKNIIRPELYIDPRAVGKEIGKQFKDIKDVFTNSMKEAARDASSGDTFNGSTKNDGQHSGTTYSEKIIEKTIVEKSDPNSAQKSSADPKIYIDPIALGKEIGKQFEGIGDDISAVLDAELKELDKNLDDSQ